MKSVFFEPGQNEPIYGIERPIGVFDHWEGLMQRCLPYPGQPFLACFNIESLSIYRSSDGFFCRPNRPIADPAFKIGNDGIGKFRFLWGHREVWITMSNSLDQ